MKAKIKASKKQLTEIGIDLDIMNLECNIIGYYSTGYREVEVSIDNSIFKFDIPFYYLELPKPPIK